MTPWTCSTAPFNDGDRTRVWDEALTHISLPASRPQSPSGFHGEVSSIVSPLGIEFSRVSSSPQTLSGSCVSRLPYLWLALPVKGRFQLVHPAGESSLGRGDILYGAAGRASTLTLRDDFVMLYVRIPQTLLHPRVLNLQTLPQGMLTGRNAANRIFAGMLHAIVDNLEDLTDDDIHPIEVALSEFVVSSLSAASAASCFDPAGASNFRRICTAIEQRLGDGGLTLPQVAQQLNVSARYVQKLFQKAGLSFGPYLRQRRLEHCRADLGNPALRSMSVSDVCFRWGFNDAAHFSRSFRAEYGMTPRAYRKFQLGRVVNCAPAAI